MQCLISITAARWNIALCEQLRSKRSKQDSLRKQVGLNQNTIKGKTCVSFRPEYGHIGFA